MGFREERISTVFHTYCRYVMSHYKYVLSNKKSGKKTLKPGFTFLFRRQEVFDFNERQECIEKVAVGVLERVKIKRVALRYV